MPGFDSRLAARSSSAAPRRSSRAADAGLLLVEVEILPCDRDNFAAPKGLGPGAGCMPRRAPTARKPPTRGTV